MSACIPNPLGTMGSGSGLTAPTAILGVSIGVFRLPTDPIGNHTVTLTNVVVGSRINIRDTLGTYTLYDQVAASANVPITLPVFSSGSSLNNWRIKVRKASGSPNYVPYETLMTSYVGASSIYVSQIPDE